MDLRLRSRPVKTEVLNKNKQGESEYGVYRAAYDLKKLRARKSSGGLKAMITLVLLRNKRSSLCYLTRRICAHHAVAQNPTTHDRHYDAIRAAVQAVFQEVGLA
jgi:hypothetical protein